MQPKIFFIFGILSIGIVSCISDLRSRYISNTALLLGLIYAIFVYMYFFYIGPPLLSLKLYLTSNLFAILLSFILYKNKLWGAGDAKLFIVFSFLSISQKNAALFKLPSISLFINTFLLSLLFFSIFAIWKIKEVLPTTKLDYKEMLKPIPDTLITIFSFSWIIWLGVNKLAFQSPLINMAILWLFYQLTNTILKKVRNKMCPLVIILLTSTITRYFVQPHIFLTPTIFFNYIRISLQITCIFLFADLLFKKMSSPMSGIPSTRIPFAPLLFLGAITVEFPLVELTMKTLQTLKNPF
ncbi:MAG TPA: prepilin peptidase [Candidatus Omnitrophota bacterium]|nr:prepilin peptidase [Candidatus Omnitrophota bacterium]